MDLIDRQAAIDAIKTWGLIDGLAEGQAIEILADEEKLPSAQPEVLACGEGELIAQPEIIRCKDCKHQVKEWRTDKRLKDNGYMVCGCDVVGDACGDWALLGQDDDYCSYAERRTDECTD